MPLNNSETNCPGSGQGRLIFAVPERQHGQEMKVVLYHLTSLPGVGEESLFQGEGIPSSQKNIEGIVVFIIRGFLYESFLSATSFVPAVAITLCFLISLLFSANCPYLSL